jgi:hypothetical protein
MIAALATITFIAAAWTGVVATARLVEENASRIAAALRGQPLPRVTPRCC